MSATVVLAIIAGVLALPAIINLIRRADLRRMAVRNAARRPVETALIIVGSALGTAIIAAALMVGDTFDSSIKDIARRELGEIDLMARFDDDAELDAAAARLAATPPELVDGQIVFSQMTVAAAAGDVNDPDRAVEPRVVLGAIDFADAATFGSAPDDYALGGVTTSPDGMVINERFADNMRVDAGDTITVLAAGAEFPIEVSDVVPEQGLGGFVDAWVSNDKLTTLGVPSSAVQRGLGVSIDGTVFDTVDDSRQVRDEVEQLLVAPGASEIEGDFYEAKRELIEDAENEGTELSTIFSVIGGFSVLAGVLLLINLFVMLAEERKPNLGVLRALGWKRRTLRQAFRAEGIVYSIPAAVLGALMGIGVGWVLIQVTRGILSAENPDSSFQLTTAVEPSSLLTAALIGLIIAMAAIAFTSWRISRLNIVTAIRDLPEPKNQRSRLLVYGAGVLAVVAGALALVTGFGNPSPFVAIISVPLIVIGIALLLRNIVPSMVLTVVGAIVTLVFAVLFFELMPAGTSIEVEFFLVYGIVMVGAGVALASVSGTLLQRLFARIDTGGIPARLAMAYPTSRVFRTASSLAMYSLIIFSLAFMAVMAKGIESSSSDIIVGSAAGHDVLVDSNGSNPLDPAMVVAEIDGVVSATAVTRSAAEFTADFAPEGYEDTEWWGMTTSDASFLDAGGLVLRDRAERFSSDREALEWVLNGGHGVLVPDWFFEPDDESFQVAVGDWVSMNVADGDVIDLEIVGITDKDYTWSGVWTSPAIMTLVDDETVATRVYVATDDGVDAAMVADRIEARFLDNGAEAESFDDRVNRFIESEVGFFSLLRGYLLLGLLIGIGGLAVTLFRAVRERRRQIGMLRSMGLASKGVGRWFLGEATYISVMGIVSGVSLGVLSAYFVATQSTAIDNETLPFVMPWGAVIFISVIPFIASGIAAVIPARRAAALRPSEALRLAD